MMPTKHSHVVGGSTAARLVNCPGSSALLAQVPDFGDRSSSYAIEGTALHTVMEMLITKQTTLERLSSGMPIRIATGEGDVEITIELIHDALRLAWDYWTDLIQKTDEWVIEAQVEFPGIKGAFGTADVIGRDERDNITYITDWKFGSGEAVKASYEGVPNEQLMFYAAAARNTYPRYFPPGCRIVLTIVQPRARDGEPVTTTEVNGGDLDAFIASLTEAIKLAAKPDAPTRKGRWCRFQACQSICPHHTGPLLDLSDKTVPRQADVNYMEVLLAILAAAPGVEELITEARAQAHVLLSNGQDVPGWKLVAKRGTRKWAVSESELPAKLGIAAENLYDSVLKSPAGVEKILPKGKKLPEGVAEMVSSGTTIAVISDKRPAVSVNPGPGLLELLAKSV